MLIAQYWMATNYTTLDLLPLFGDFASTMTNNAGNLDNANADSANAGNGKYRCQNCGNIFLRNRAEKQLHTCDRCIEKAEKAIKVDKNQKVKKDKKPNNNRQGF